MTAGYLKEVCANEIRSLVGEIIYPSVSLPGQIFQPPYTQFCFYDYSHLQDAACWKTLIDVLPGDSVQVVFLDPDFVYIHDREPGNAYGVIRIDPGSTVEELKALIHSSPTSQPLETFCFGGPKCLLVPKSRVWVMWADRKYDLAIAAFSELRERERFIHSLSMWKPMCNVADALRFLTANSHKLSKEFFLDPMARNYASEYERRLST